MQDGVAKIFKGQRHSTLQLRAVTAEE